MCYKHLYNIYFNDAEKLKRHIQILKKSSINSQELKYRISVLYNMYSDLTYVLEYLNKKCEGENYYEK